MAEDPNLPGVSDAELAEAFKQPAQFCNRFYVTVSPVTARIAFGERQSDGGGVHIRSAVAMTIGDLMELRDLLDQVLQSAEPRTLPSKDG